MAYLRLYSVIPIFILLIELGWVSWMRFRKSNLKNPKKFTAQIMISNIVVLNSYAFGQIDDRFEDEKSIKRFVLLSTLITFAHHASILAIIMVIGYIQPPEFFISTLKIEAGSEDFNLMLGGLIGVGILSLAINLCYFNWDKVSKCCSTKTESIDEEVPIELTTEMACALGLDGLIL